MNLFSERIFKNMNASLRASTFSADSLGVWASALCVVHCVVTPVMVSMSVVMARFIPGEERTHRALAVGVAALGAMALVKGSRTHGRKRILGLMALGLAFIFVGAFFGERLPSHGYEVAVTMTGSALMICAHRMNHTFCRECRRCTHSDAGVC
ncbi:MerC domain-containing protein [Tunturiibacter gelidiferens]|uniref:MerC domain-containing protein n=1 Tax=Tunturiibacter gelidiferens TaxID=3069689 RepID=A0AAU7Z3C2_9BACT